MEFSRQRPFVWARLKIYYHYFFYINKAKKQKQKNRPESWSKNETICHLVLSHLTSHIIITMNFNSENLFFKIHTWAIISSSHRAPVIVWNLELYEMKCNLAIPLQMAFKCLLVYSDTFRFRLHEWLRKHYSSWWDMISVSEISLKRICVVQLHVMERK